MFVSNSLAFFFECPVINDPTVKAEQNTILWFSAIIFWNKLLEQIFKILFLASASGQLYHSWNNSYDLIYKIINLI